MRAAFNFTFSIFIALLASVQSLPNIIVIFADDLGYGDVGCFGNPTIYTPNIDQMAREGLRFTQWYSGYSVCSPSRAALMTGRLPPRSGMGTVFSCDNIGGIPANETTLAELLRAQGYATAMLGKWHLGQREQFLPTHNGFDSYTGVPFSVDQGGQFGSPAVSCPYLPFVVNTTVIKQPMPLGEIEPEYARLATEYIGQRDHKRPFFLYMANSHAHVAVVLNGTAQWSSPEFTNTSRRGRYGDAVEELDWVVGKILNKVRSEGIANNTLVFFTSDNGPWMEKLVDAGTPGQFRGRKGTTWEGGIRVPAIAWWPGKIPAAAETQEVASTMDIFTTVAKIVGAKLPNVIIDGRDISDILFRDGKSPHDFVFHWNGRANDHRLCAVRHGSFKIHYYTNEHESWAPTNLTVPLLFNIEQDASELYPLPLEEYKTEVQALLTATRIHLSQMHQAVDQFSIGTNSSLALCCNRKTNCVCNQD